MNYQPGDGAQAYWRAVWWHIRTGRIDWRWMVGSIIVGALASQVCR